MNLGILKYDANNVSFFMFSLGSAILEEYGFRGIVFPKVMQVVKGSSFRKLMFGITISGVLFGLIHFQNIFYQPFLVTFQQGMGAIPFGILMAVLYARTSTILIPMLFHFVSDFNSYFTTNSFFAGAFYNSWWQVLINYAIALLAAIIFLRPAVANKIKLINHD
ncbi:CPBP family intramembrane glutamic endopeptidase [Fructilactobacillus sanfranciscensis]|uniref:CPBP family intramembrane glutamic endopeptidase n=1 Tax=Fructilactobacillus sanfranciscensis TaxID=1625 RepID=UPI0031FA126B